MVVLLNGIFQMVMGVADEIITDKVRFCGFRSKYLSIVYR